MLVRISCCSALRVAHSLKSIEYEKSGSGAPAPQMRGKQFGSVSGRTEEKEARAPVSPYSITDLLSGGFTGKGIKLADRGTRCIRSDLRQPKREMRINLSGRRSFETSSEPSEISAMCWFYSGYGGDDGARTRDLCRDRVGTSSISTTYRLLGTAKIPQNTQ
ncbi:hypothetical protein SBA5_680021 [Candidatus Sulfotelmatomonas gaucii]|uniref:Uncharacterized protein n=1 Tax=Candidatus Sulfuritelmatomonas gaucii TaxID=2043161 RepID=A0A2N9LZL5_9BACT|nr:hypothetical protein SBA5_680021 [Candidatus Sulfotelmatomonas gaucii]